MGNYLVPHGLAEKSIQVFKLKIMQKSTLFVLFLTFGNTLYSQMSFYLRPTVNMKTNQSHFFGDRISRPIYHTVANEYFSISADKSYFDGGNINLGIHVGAKIKEKHFFELGYSGDNSGVKTQAGGHSWTYDSDFSPAIPVISGGNHVGSTFGKPFTRLSFTYNSVLYKNSTNTLHVRGTVGFGSLFNRFVDRKKLIFDVEEHPSFTMLLDSNVYNTQYIITSVNPWRHSPYLNLGLGFDFYSKNRHKYLFSFDLFYLQGTRNVQVDTHRIWIEDHGEEKIFRYLFMSKGSGIYFTLSRRIQVYPWRPNRSHTPSEPKSSLSQSYNGHFGFKGYSGF
jgi:hypothetical protein